jgi:hypothetical protein
MLKIPSQIMSLYDELLARQNISCFLNKLEEKIRMNNKRSKPFMQYQFFIGFAGENLRDVHL